MALARTAATSPLAMTSTVPSTGASAAVPGYGVDGVMRKNDRIITASPTHPKTVAAVAGIRLTVGATRAKTPPAPSSHARVGKEKKAHG